MSKRLTLESDRPAILTSMPSYRNWTRNPFTLGYKTTLGKVGGSSIEIKYVANPIMMRARINT